MAAEDRQKIETRRQDVYRLYLDRWSQETIAKFLHVSQQTVSNDIKIIRRWNADWFNKHKPRDVRMRVLYKELLDTLDKLYNDGVIIFSKIRDSATTPRDWLDLDRVRESLERNLDRRRVLLLSKEVNETWLEEQMKVIEQQHKDLREVYQKKIKELEEEKTLRERVHPIA